MRSGHEHRRGAHVMRTCPATVLVKSYPKRPPYKRLRFALLASASFVSVAWPLSALGQTFQQSIGNVTDVLTASGNLTTAIQTFAEGQASDIGTPLTNYNAAVLPAAQAADNEITTHVFPFVPETVTTASALVSYATAPNGAATFGPAAGPLFTNQALSAFFLGTDQTGQPFTFSGGTAQMGGAINTSAFASLC